MIMDEPYRIIVVYPNGPLKSQATSLSRIARGKI